MREEFSIKANFVCCMIYITGFVLCFDFLSFNRNVYKTSGYVTGLKIKL